MMESRIETLEISHAHLEAAVDELTATVLQQQQVIGELRNEIEFLKSLLKDLAPASVAPRSEETPPPHY
jgi:SlyX protein